MGNNNTKVEVFNQNKSQNFGFIEIENNTNFNSFYQKVENLTKIKNITKIILITKDVHRVETNHESFDSIKQHILDQARKTSICFLIENANETVYKNMNVNSQSSQKNENKLEYGITFIKELKGHTNYVYSLIKINEATIVSGSYDKSIKVWNIDSGECLKTLLGHKNGIKCLLKLNDTTIVSGSTDMAVKIWNVETGECLNTLLGHTDSVYSLSKLYETSIVSGSSDNSIKIWNVNSVDCLKTLVGHKDCIRCLLNINENTIVSGSSDYSLKS